VEGQRGGRKIRFLPIKKKKNQNEKIKEHLKFRPEPQS